MIMTHAGLPYEWVMIVSVLVLILTLWAVKSDVKLHSKNAGYSLTRLFAMGKVFRYLTQATWPLFILKIVFAGLFILILAAGLWGSPIVERNLATTLTWNLWWTGIVIAIFFTGSAWCAVCPWDNIASWLVNHRIWARSNNSLQLKLPKYLRSVWPASVLFIGFTWLELGIGVVASPYATALLALAMVVLATTALALFEGKAFCRYMCPVGRTVGVYSQLSPVALRPIDVDTCKQCTSLECYHGSEAIAACPTQLVMGRLQENTYCISCGNCTQSCPSQNISWQLRSPSSEAIVEARPHLDEAFFMLILFALTLFHGLTMVGAWESYLSQMAQLIHDTNQFIFSFSIGLVTCILLPIIIYSGAVAWTFRWVNARRISAAGVNKPSFKKLFSGFAFINLPLAFSYHISHNLNHFFREANDWVALFKNPLGTGTQPLSMMEKHTRHMDIMVPEQMLFTLQALLIAAGYFIAVQVIRHRGSRLFGVRGTQLIPMLTFAVLATAFNLWLLIQPMTMRM